MESRLEMKAEKGHANLGEYRHSKWVLEIQLHNLKMKMQTRHLK
jgi:hypothetical protein